MDEQIPLENAEPGSDYAAIRQGRISITPLRFDNTADDLITSLRTWLTAPPS
jgi:broad specificity polyphosphatase/5'/3'-nucleotidase SurE